MGKLIVFEAGDGSGKATQAELLFQRLFKKGYNVRKIEFPNYNSPSSSLIKMYLKGEFGANPNDINPYAASTFFAVDRFATYKKDWEDFYLSGGIVVADRYTTSNLVHQMSKINDPQEKVAFQKWLLDLEYNKFQLPVPDCVIFLDMPPEVSRKLRGNRPLKAGERDIHESNEDYLALSYKTAKELADYYQWKQVLCVEGDRIKSVEAIHEEIYAMVVKIL